jgi:hypothetical protein
VAVAAEVSLGDSSAASVAAGVADCSKKPWTVAAEVSLGDSPAASSCRRRGGLQRAALDGYGALEVESLDNS